MVYFSAMREEDAVRLDIGDLADGKFCLCGVCGEGRRCTLKAPIAATDQVTDEERSFAMEETDVTWGVPRSCNDPQVIDCLTIDKSTRRQRRVTPDCRLRSKRDDLGQPTDVIRVIVTEQNVADIGPGRSKPAQRATEFSGRTWQARVDQRKPSRMRHQEAPDVEVHRVGSGKSSRKMHVERHRMDFHASRLRRRRRRSFRMPPTGSEPAPRGGHRGSWQVC